MVRKVIAFDLDGTLAPSKSIIPERMSTALAQLLDKYEVLVMSGGKFEQFETQFLAHFRADAVKLSRLHLMPTCGTRYYRYDEAKKAWQQVYAEDLTEAEKQKIINAISKGVDHLNLQEPKTYGPTIEDRGSQISWSALGQNIVAQLGDEGVRLKEKWDPDVAKRRRLRSYVAELIPEFEVRVGGGTTIDITKPGIDKAYGAQKLMDKLELSKEDIFFIGDRLEEDGNDYPVKAFGIDCLQISNWQETAMVVEAICAVS